MSGALDRVVERNALGLDRREVVGDRPEIAGELLDNISVLVQGPSELGLVPEHVDAERGVATARLCHQRKAVPRDEGRAFVVAALDERRREREVVASTQLRADLFVAYDASRRRAAAKQAVRELWVPVPKGREKFDIVVTAGDDEVHAFPVHDVEQGALERIWLRGSGRYPVDDIEVEERGLVRHARRPHEQEPVATAIERGQNILTDPGADREYK